MARIFKDYCSFLQLWSLKEGLDGDIEADFLCSITGDKCESGFKTWNCVRFSPTGLSPTPLPRLPMLLGGVLEAKEPTVSILGEDVGLVLDTQVQRPFYCKTAHAQNISRKHDSL